MFVGVVVVISCSLLFIVVAVVIVVFVGLLVCSCASLLACLALTAWLLICLSTMTVVDILLLNGS